MFNVVYVVYNVVQLHVTDCIQYVLFMSLHYFASDAVVWNRTALDVSDMQLDHIEGWPYYLVFCTLYTYLHPALLRKLLPFLSVLLLVWVMPTLKVTKRKEKRKQQREYYPTCTLLLWIYRSVRRTQANLVEQHQMCALCVTLYCRIMLIFSGGWSSNGSQLKKKSKYLNHQPVCADFIRYCDLRRQNEWPKVNVFDAIRNYIFCCSCTSGSLKISKQRIAQKGAVKWKQYQEPLRKLRWRSNDLVTMWYCHLLWSCLLRSGGEICVVLFCRACSIPVPDMGMLERSQNMPRPLSCKTFWYLWTPVVSRMVGVLTSVANILFSA